MSRCGLPLDVALAEGATDEARHRASNQSPTQMTAYLLLEPQISYQQGRVQVSFSSEGFDGQGTC